MLKRATYLMFLLPILMACKKSFSPNLVTKVTNYLAVDGAIISGDSTYITLSRTTALSDTTQKKVELKATLSIEDDQGKMYPFSEKGKGVYTLGVTNFSASRQYRLDIKTTDGKTYQSDFVPMKTTPPIDSIYFKQTSDKTVLFYVNAHDPTNSTRYYRWDYKETWSYAPLFLANYQFKNGQIVPIVPDGPDDISVCYRTAFSNQIFIGSSTKLAEDVISNQLLGGIVGNSEKTGHVYVMQLKQYALTKEGFDYYQNLQVNSEQLGSIFDSQPSSLRGNIHCVTSPSDLVVGFVSVSTTSKKQFNLRGNTIPLRGDDPYGNIAWNPPYEFYGSFYFKPPDTSDCHFKTISTYPYATFATRFAAAMSGGQYDLIDCVADIPPQPSDQPGPSFLEPNRTFGLLNVYHYAPKNCVDCRLKGGTNIRPSYFPYPAY